MDLHLAGKNAIVTGATRGIGRAIAQRFTGEGANVAICARQSETVGETVASLRISGTTVSGKALAGPVAPSILNPASALS